MVKVFTIGIFDILHAEHIAFLKFAKSHGTHLIVGVYTDESAKKISGKHAPILCLHDRLTLIKELRCVDSAIPVDDPSPESLIRAIKPDVLVKNPEAQKYQNAGVEFVESYGGKVVVAKQTRVKTTTEDVIRKIKEQR